MKLLNRMTTVFFRLFLSYAALLLVTTLLIGITSHLYFTSNFNAEIEKLHARMLNHTNEILDNSLFSRPPKLYIELINDKDVLYLFEHGVEGNHAKLLDVQEKVKDMMRRYPDILDSIYLYYRNSNLVLSSQHGVAYLDRIPDKITMNTDWIRRMDATDRNATWFETREMPANSVTNSDLSSIISYVRGYPINKTKTATDGYVSINLKASAVYALIRSADAEDTGQELIVDHEGHLVSSGNSRASFNLLENGQAMERIAASADAPSSFFQHVGGTKLFISYATLPTTGWKLIQATPVDQFFRKSSAIQRNLIWICLTAVGIGLLLAHRLTFNMYNPLRRLLHSVRGMFGPHLPLPDKGGNEFKQIDRMFNNLSLKMIELERTVEDNLPLIKHTLVTGLLYRTIMTPAELQERLMFLGLDWEGASHRAISLSLGSQLLNGLDLEQRQIVVYNLIREWERQMPEGTASMAIWSDNRIWAIMTAHRPDDSIVYRTIQHLQEYAARHFGLRPVAAAGGWVGDALELHCSFQQAERYAAYSFMFPDARVFDDRQFREREASMQEIPEGLLPAFEDALRSGRPGTVSAVLLRFVATVRETPFSLERCQAFCRELLDRYAHYLKDIHAKPAETQETALLDSIGAFPDIDQLRACLSDHVERTHRAIQERTASKSAELLTRAKAYIAGHLDQDIGLNDVADHVHLNPSYLSQLFKEETGINFVDYMTRLRLDSAADLIRNTDLKVEAIAQRVGYNSAAYFIRKFKETYGVTPGMFKSNYNESSQE